MTSWKPLDNCDSLPGRVEDWLAEPGSLTARVRSRCPENFRLKVIDQRREGSVAVFDDLEPSEILCREITLGCGDTPLVFARTRIPAVTLAANPWLGELGGTPLGTRLFDEPGYMRGRFFVARLVRGDALYDCVNESVTPLGDELWARKARVELKGKPFEICECFLPGLI
ncbi:MAG TPA: chorismate lyase [Gammaproteobacteria bacterium]